MAELKVEKTLGTLKGHFGIERYCMENGKILNVDWTSSNGEWADAWFDGEENESLEVCETLFQSFKIRRA